MSARTGILVCGMHRSGTSALGGALQACGVVLRDDMPADENNPKGYFEKQEIADLHEEFFQQFGLSGVSLDPLPEGWETGEAAERILPRIAGLAENNFGTEALWAVKDPRLCRLVSLWKRALSQVDLCAVLAMRHPLEVAGSLQRRDGFSWSRGLLFWLRYVLEAERNTRGMKRAVIRYEDLLLSPLSEMLRLEDELELRWPESSEHGSENLKSWVDVTLNRNATVRQIPSSKELDALVHLCLEVYDLFQPESFHQNRPRLDALWNQCAIHEDSFTYTVISDDTKDGAAASGFTLSPDDPFQGRVLKDGWNYSRWFGFYNGTQFPWINHVNLGFMYICPMKTDLYLYGVNGNSGDLGWLYTTRSLFPHFYSFSRSTWLSYAGGNWFYNHATSSWETYGVH